MVPIGLLLIFLKNHIVMTHLDPSRGHGVASHVDDHLEISHLDEEDVDDKEEDKEEKKTLRAKLQAVQEVTAMVQNALGQVANLGEAIKNTFNYSVPYLSWLAIVILFAASILLYFISLRLIIILWGINKFTKKLIRPNYVPNNELMDFLSRVPDDETLKDCRELKYGNLDEAAMIAAQHAQAAQSGTSGTPAKKKKKRE